MSWSDIPMVRTDTKKTKGGKYTRGVISRLSVNPANVRPDEASGMGGTKTRVVSGVTRIGYKYPDPVGYAATEIAKLDDAGVSDMIARLYQAGYFSREEAKLLMWRDDNGTIVPYPEKTTTLRKLLTQAMTDANMNGVTYQEWTAYRYNQIEAGQRGAFRGESAAETKKQDSAGGPKTSTIRTLYITPRQTADRKLDDSFKEMFGRVATQKEKDEFYKSLSKKQNNPKNASVYTSTTANGIQRASQTEAGVNVDDEIEDFAISKVNFANDKSIGTGTIREKIIALKSAASDYGSSLSKKDIVKYGTGLVRGEYTDATIREQLANAAKVHYRAFSDKITNETSVRDLASNYITRKARILELDPSQIGLKDVENAMTGNVPMSYQEFDTSVKRDPRYQNTTEAKTNALDFANTILKAFGYGG